MKSKPNKLHDKLFRYDFDRCVVEYISKASAEDLADEAEWKKKYGSGLLGIDEDGYFILESVGLCVENWKNKRNRNEYLADWVVDLDEEATCLAADFERYELPDLRC